MSSTPARATQWDLSQKQANTQTLNVLLQDFKTRCDILPTCCWLCFLLCWLTCVFHSCELKAKDRLSLCFHGALTARWAYPSLTDYLPDTLCKHWPASLFCKNQSGKVIMQNAEFNLTLNFNELIYIKFV